MGKPMDIKVTVLIMAGKRSGIHDPLAQRAGVSQKCDVPVRGVPMIERVLREVAACDRVDAIHIVAHDSDEIETLRGQQDIYFAEGAHAAGILEGVAHYDFFGEMGRTRAA